MYVSTNWDSTALESLTCSFLCGHVLLQLSPAIEQHVLFNLTLPCHEECECCTTFMQHKFTVAMCMALPRPQDRPSQSSWGKKDELCTIMDKSLKESKKCCPFYRKKKYAIKKNEKKGVTERWSLEVINTWRAREASALSQHGDKGISFHQDDCQISLTETLAAGWGFPYLASAEHLLQVKPESANLYCYLCGRQWLFRPLAKNTG